MKKDYVVLVIVMITIFAATKLLGTGEEYPRRYEGPRVFTSTNFPGYDAENLTRTNLEYRWRKCWGAIAVDEIDADGSSPTEILVLNRGCHDTDNNPYEGSIAVLSADAKDNFGVLYEIDADTILGIIKASPYSHTEADIVYLTAIKAGDLDGINGDDIVFGFFSQDSPTSHTNWIGIIYNDGNDFSSPTIKFDTVENLVYKTSATAVDIEIVDSVNNGRQDIFVLFSEDYLDEGVCEPMAENPDKWGAGHLEVLVYDTGHESETETDYHAPDGEELYDLYTFEYPTDMLYYDLVAEEELVDCNPSCPDDREFLVVSQVKIGEDGVNAARIYYFDPTDYDTAADSITIWPPSSPSDDNPFALAKGDDLDDNDGEGEGEPKGEIVIAIEADINSDSIDENDWDDWPLDLGSGEEAEVTYVYYYDPHLEEQIEGPIYDPAASVYVNNT